MIKCLDICNSLQSCCTVNQVLITDDFLQRLDKDLDDLTRPNEVIINHMISGDA